MMTTKRGSWVSLARILRAVLVTYLLVVLAMMFIEDWLVYPAPSRDDGDWQAANLEHEDVWFTSADGTKLHGWFVPGDTPDRKARAVVLFHHGNAGNISHRLETLALLNGLGLSTCIFDYRGYGKSSGRPTERGVYLDARAVWDWLADEQGVAPGRVVVWGRSLGSAVAARLARDLAGEGVRPAALVLESAFTSVPDMGRTAYPFLPVRLIARMRMRTVDYVRGVNCPVLVAHSPSDEIVPYAQGRAVFDAAPEPKRFFELRGGHNDGFLVTGRDYVQGVDAFLRDVTK